VMDTGSRAKPVFVDRGCRPPYEPPGEVKIGPIGGDGYVESAAGALGRRGEPVVIAAQLPDRPPKATSKAGAGRVLRTEGQGHDRPVSSIGSAPQFCCWCFFRRRAFGPPAAGNLPAVAAILPLDCEFPDLSDTQVIVYTEYSPGQAPPGPSRDQVTYPLTDGDADRAAPRKVVRGVLVLSACPLSM